MALSFLVLLLFFQVFNLHFLPPPFLMVLNECQECHIVGRDSPFEGEIFVRGDEHCVISGRGAFRTQ